MMASINAGEEAALARISSLDHARILALVDVEGRKVAEVAAEYGCTRANIYALLAKLRGRVAAAPEAAPDPVAEAAPDLVAEAAPDPVAEAASAGPDLFAAAAAASGRPAAPPRTEPAQAPGSPPEDAAPQARPPVAASVTALRPGRPPASAGVGARLGKPGWGLVLRSAEGDENLTPFRSLEDLLSAVKPILRAASSSAEPVWFSIRPVDLASLDSDAA